MFNIDRIYDLEMDLSQVSTIQTKIEFKQYDYGSCFINIIYHNKGVLLENIKKNKVIGVFKNSEGQLFIDENTNKPVRSLARITSDNTVMMMIPDEVLKNKAKITCETIIITPENKRVTSSAFIFNIQESLLDIDFE
jgi:hypothetical protein